MSEKIVMKCDSCEFVLLRHAYLSIDKVFAKKSRSHHAETQHPQSWTSVETIDLADQWEKNYNYNLMVKK